MPWQTFFLQIIIPGTIFDLVSLFTLLDAIMSQLTKHFVKNDITLFVTNMFYKS
jgi:putative effector of murein hydrolase LrgA (UPF0299 family)